MAERPIVFSLARKRKVRCVRDEKPAVSGAPRQDSVYGSPFGEERAIFCGTIISTLNAALVSRRCTTKRGRSTEVCGRYALYGPSSRIREQFDLDEGFDLAPRYNIAPSTQVFVVRQGADGRRVASLCAWGLVPSWAKDSSIGAKLLNARAETVAVKPAFRAAFRRGRCIVPANGFYEWTSVEEGGRRARQPYYVRPRDDRELFGFAGLCEQWLSPLGEEIRTCCIITTDANALMEPIHDRMPAILAPKDYAAWLDPAGGNDEFLHHLLRRAKPVDMFAYAVCRAVNSSRSDLPRFVDPL